MLYCILIRVFLICYKIWEPLPPVAEIQKSIYYNNQKSAAKKTLSRDVK